MKQLLYVGPHTEGVDVPGVGDVVPDVPVSVADDVAASLLEQPTNWQSAPNKAVKADAPKEG